MAVSSIAELNIAIRADIKGLERGIRDAQRVLTQAGQSFTTLGNNLSMSLTAPLLGFGIASVKAAGDMERLRLGLEATMTGAGYSITQTTDEMKALNEAAKAPGLDLEQAVKGSLRLQNVGYSAEKARGIMAQFANAVASAGGTAQNFDGVTTQLAQMIGKGKILNEDLKVMKENMPGVAKAMIDAFGTADAEGIRALGISTTEFTDRLVDQLAKMPRVSGGISNAIVNAGVAMKQFLATVGEGLNKTFNISGNLTAFADWMGELSKKFNEASSGTQALIIGTGVLLAAIGPLTRMVGLAVQGVGALTIAYRNLRIAKLAIVDVGFIKYWRALDTAMKVTVIGAVLAGVLALALAFKALNREMSPAEKAQRSINAAYQEAAHSIAAEKSQAEQLTAILKSETATREQKNAALKKLQAMAPEIFGNLSTEKLKVDDVNKALNAYISLIEKRARLAALNAKLVEVESKLYDTQHALNEEAKPGVMAQMVDVVLSLGNASEAAVRSGQRMVKNQAELTTGYEKQKEVLLAEIGTLQTFEMTTTKAAVATGGMGKESEKMAKTLASTKTALTAYDEKTKLLGATESSVAGKTKLLEASITKLLKAGFEPASDEVENLVKQLEALGNSKKIAPLDMTGPKKLGQVSSIDQKGNALDALKGVSQDGNTAFDAAAAGMESFGSLYTRVSNGIEADSLRMQTHILGSKNAVEALGVMMGATGSAMKNAMVMAGGAAQQYAEQGGTSFADMGKAALKGAADVVRSFIMQGVAAAAAKALAFLPFPVNLVAAAGAAAAAGVLFNKAISAIGIPALADGGIASGPTMAMVGEYPGAKSNPEVIAPLNKLKALMGSGRNGGNNNGGGRLTCEIDGRRLLFLLEAEQSRRNRTY